MILSWKKNSMEEIIIRFWEQSAGKQQVRKYNGDTLRKMLLEQEGITEKCKLEYAEVFSVSNESCTMENQYLAQAIYPKKELDFIVSIPKNSYALIYFHIKSVASEQELTLFDTITFKD